MKYFWYLMWITHVGLWLVTNVAMWFILSLVYLFLATEEEDDDED